MRHKKQSNSFPAPHYVSAYAVTRHYGGPEEGGWWYDWYHHIESSPRLRPRKLDHYRKRFEAKYDHVREGDISSVLGGTDICVSFERWPGEFASTRTPHYE